MQPTLHPRRGTDVFQGQLHTIGFMGRKEEDSSFSRDFPLRGCGSLLRGGTLSITASALSSAFGPSLTIKVVFTYHVVSSGPEDS